MDLSKSQPNNNTGFIDLINPQEEEDDGDRNKEEIVPSYDFQPIRPLGSPRQHSHTLDSGNGVGGGARVWSSADSQSISPAIAVRNYGSLDSIEPAKSVPVKDHNASNAALVSEIDRTMKKYVDDLMHVLDSVSARISQLESRSRNLENSVDDLKVAVGNNQGSTDGKLRQLENILREVQSGVQVIRDKQDILEGQLHLAKLQVPNIEHQPEPQGRIQPDTLHQIASAPMQSHHHQLPPPPPSMSQPPISIPPPNAPPPAPQQSLPPSVHLPNQYTPNQIPPSPQRDPYYSPPSQPQETATQQYPPPPPQLPQPSLSASPPQLPQYPPALPQYSQPPPPQQHPSLSSMNPPAPQLPLSHHSEDSPYPPQSYPPSLSQPGHPPNAANPSSQQFYGSASHMYEPPSSRPGSGYPPTYGPSSGPNEPPPYPYGGPPSQYGGGGMKSQMSTSHGSGSGYPQLPTARVLPQALPTASTVGGGSGGSSGTGNRVPIDDVVDKVTNMGFSRDQVRATVRKLTENGQSVDLNIVLDKLMNDGVEGQPPRGWFGR